MQISIGIMLWNEDVSIESTIDSIFRQTLFTTSKPNVESVEVVALANGCSDNSIPNATIAFERNLKKCPLSYVSARVVELPKGRQPAWNKFVHEMTGKDVTYIFFMDADIDITGPEAMWSMVQGLENDKKKHVATGAATKNIELSSKKTLWQKLSIAMSRMEKDARFFYVTGQLYCGRAEFFRNMLFPKGFVCGDDGFIGMMAITNYMTTEYEWDRISYPPEAIYVYEAYLSLGRLFRQHRRRMVGATVNAMIRDFVRSKQQNGQPDAGLIIRRASEEDPDWLDKYVLEVIKRRGFWVASPRNILYRFSQLRRLSLLRKLIRLPLAIMGAMWSASVIYAANRMFHKGTYRGAWESMPNQQMK